MEEAQLNRKRFLSLMGKAGLCACAISAAASLEAAYASASRRQEKTDAQSERPFRSRFINQWTPRFFGVFASIVDPAIAQRVMSENGKACYDAWIQETHQEHKPVDFETWTSWAIKNNHEEGFRIEGNDIYFQYNGAAETGQQSEENHCLCPLVEDKPQGLNPIYCHCSVGYVKRMHQLLFADRKVEVELIDSVLRGGKRCKFKISVI
jgi:hypothetical protein